MRDGTAGCCRQLRRGVLWTGSAGAIASFARLACGAATLPPGWKRLRSGGHVYRDRAHRRDSLGVPPCPGGAGGRPPES